MFDADQTVQSNFVRSHLLRNILVSDFVVDGETHNLIVYTILSAENVARGLRAKGLQFGSVADVPQRDMEFTHIDERMWLTEKQERTLLRAARG